MDDTLSAIWANPVYRKLILSAIVLLASMVIRQLLHLLLINRLSDDSPHIYVVRKVTGFSKPSQQNEAAFLAAVEEITAVTTTLLNLLQTNAPAKNRAEEAAKALARAAKRFPQE